MPKYSGDPTKEVYKAVYDILRADAPFMALIGNRLYDAIPENEIFPYLKIGPFVFKDGGSHTSRGFDGDLSFSTFTSTAQVEGSKEAQDILANLFNILEEKGINITGLGMVSCRRVFLHIFKDPSEGEIWQGICRFRLLMGG